MVSFSSSSLYYSSVLCDSLSDPDFAGIKSSQVLKLLTNFLERVLFQVFIETNGMFLENGAFIA